MPLSTRIDTRSKSYYPSTTCLAVTMYAKSSPTAFFHITKKHVPTGLGVAPDAGSTHTKPTIFLSTGRMYTGTTSNAPSSYRYSYLQPGDNSGRNPSTGSFDKLRTQSGQAGGGGLGDEVGGGGFE